MADLKKPVAPKRSRFGNIFAFGIILIFVIAVVYLLTSDSEEIQVYEYSTYITKIENLEIATAVSTPMKGADNSGFMITGTLANNAETKYEVEVPSEESLQDLINLYFTTNI